MVNQFSRRSILKGLLGGVALSLAPIAPLAFAGPSDLAVQAVQRALAGDFGQAGSLAAQSNDQSAIKLVELIYLKDHGPEAGFQRIQKFLSAAPNWPLNETLMKRAEQALYENKQSGDVVFGYFKNR